ncbi:hypothetical protein FGRMN_1663 [Fusarium graminum]|nr:hypothetical protein FGRMN_1663 [Fusarium graminum]
MDTENEQLRLEFVLRHVDDEPAIADCWSLTEAAQKITITAMNLAVIGEVDGATKLLQTLKDNGSDPFRHCDREYPFLKPCMFFAWEATSSWPSWIDQEERTKEKLQDLELEGRKLWLERFSEEWEATEDTAEKAMDMAYNGLVAALPDRDGTLAGQVAQVQMMWEDGDFSYSSNPNGPISVRYLKIAMWWRQGIFPYPYLQLYRTAGLTIALDIYLHLGEHDKATEVFEKICSRFHTEEQIEHLACSRMAWKKILAAPERPILDLVHIHPAKLRAAVSRAVRMAEDRLRNGPRRRYATYNMEKLIEVISENTFKNGPYDKLDAYRPYGKFRSRPDNLHGLLRKGCPASEILALEKRLGVTLPEDYKEFLSITNGLGSIWNGQNVLDYLAKAEDVCWMQTDFLSGNVLPLLLDGEPKLWENNALDWPEIGNAYCVSLSGDTEEEEGEANGHLFLAGPGLVQPAKDYFFKVYEERNEAQRQELDNLVQKTYGSMEVFQNLEYVVVSWTPWDLEFLPFNGIQRFLEWVAEASLRNDRPWLNIFEPRFRRLA